MRTPHIASAFVWMTRATVPLNLGEVFSYQRLLMDGDMRAQSSAEE